MKSSEYHPTITLHSRAKRHADLQKACQAAIAREWHKHSGMSTASSLPPFDVLEIQHDTFTA